MTTRCADKNDNPQPALGVPLVVPGVARAAKSSGKSPGGPPCGAPVSKSFAYKQAQSGKRPKGADADDRVQCTTCKKWFDRCKHPSACPQPFIQTLAPPLQLSVQGLAPVTRRRNGASCACRAWPLCRHWFHTHTHPPTQPTRAPPPPVLTTPRRAMLPVPRSLLPAPNRSKIRKHERANPSHTFVVEEESYAQDDEEDKGQRAVQIQVR